MKILDEPNSPFDLSPPTYREISKIIHKMKSSGSACPLDRVSVIALKKFPILRYTLHRIIVYCWHNNIIPDIWRRGFCVLIYNKGSPKQPYNFTSITLEPICAKVLVSLIRSRVCSYFIKSNCIEADIQKGFWTEISGTIEHTETLTYMINHARRYQKNLIITLLYLTSTFDELDH